MTVSVEIVAIVISSVTLLLAFFGLFIGGFRWMIHRADAQFERFEERIDARFRRFEERIDARFRRFEERVDGRFSDLDRELVEIKVAVARIEGPPRQLLIP